MLKFTELSDETIDETISYIQEFERNNNNLSRQLILVIKHQQDKIKELEEFKEFAINISDDGKWDSDGSLFEEGYHCANEENYTALKNFSIKN